MHSDTTRYRAGKTILSVLAVGIVAGVSPPARADNPIVQTYYTADPAPMVSGDRLYLYTSHDEDVTVSNFYTMNDWRLYSTVDMVNWTDHGSPAGMQTFSWSTDNAWAPQCVERDGKFYLYVPLNNNTGAKIGVAVADSPFGPFEDAIGRELVSNGSMAIDPTVFVDDDGQAYLYWGNGNLRFVKLNEDMTSTSGSVTSDVPMNQFTEGPWFYKRGSLYYLVYAGGGEKISYATSNAPEGPWTFKGDIFGNPSIATNHPGVVDFKGHSYMFYHTGALPGGGSFKRSVCVEEFTYGADGSIPQLTMTDEGPDGIATLNPFEQVEAETIAFSSGLKTEACDDTGEGQNVSSISDGDYIKVKDVDFLDGVTSFEARVSSSGSDAKIELHLDSESGTSLGTCDVSGASSWTTKTCEVSGGSGTHDLFLKFVGGGGDLFKFNWWKFTGPTIPNDGVGGGGNGGAGGSAEPGAGGTPGAGGSADGAGGSTGQNGGSPSMGGATSGSGGGSGGVFAGVGGAGNGGSLSGTGGRLGVGGAGTGGTLSGTGGSLGVGGSVAATGGKGGTTSGQAGSLAAAGSLSGSVGGGAGSTQAVGGTAGSGTVDAADDPESSSCACQLGARSRFGGLQGALLLLGSALLVWRRNRRQS